jgi:alcohol dehydrogenase class IV
LYKILIRLRDAGVTADKLPAIAKAAINDGSLAFNPVDADYDDALKVLNLAF